MTFDELLKLDGGASISPELIARYKETIIKNKVSPVHSTTQFERVLELGNVCRIGFKSYLYSATRVLNGAYVGDHSVIGRWCVVGESASIGDSAVLLPQSEVGRSASLDGSVVVGRKVIIPDKVQVGYGMIIPSQETIMTLGNMGTHNRTVTVHGSSNGPRYSAGCQTSDEWEVFRDRIDTAEGTSIESAAHYKKYKNVLSGIGRVVQNAFERDERLGVLESVVAEAAEMRSILQEQVFAGDF